MFICVRSRREFRPIASCSIARWARAATVTIAAIMTVITIFLIFLPFFVAKMPFPSQK